jgi:hypothetical protein
MRPINKKIELIGKFLLIFVAIFALTSVLGLVAGAVGLVYGVGTVVGDGTLTVQEATTQDVIDMPDVERRVSVYKQWQTPLLTLMSQSKPLSVESWRKEYYAVDARGLTTTISAATTISNSVVTLTVADSTMFTKFNTVYFPEITTATTKVGAGTGNSVMGIITSVGDSSTITVKIVNPGTTLAGTDFVTNPVMNVYRGGSAHNELAASALPWGINPATDYNFIQLFMEQVEEGEVQKLMKKEADWGMADLKRMAIEDFKMQRERTFLNGVRGKTSITIDGVAKDFYTCGGFLQDTGIPVLGNQDLSDLAAATTNATFVTWLKTIFTGNNGSRKRYMLAGADVIAAIETMKIDNRFLLAKETEQIYGIDFVKLVSSFGVLDLMYYEQLDLLGKQKTAIVIDKENIYTGDLKGKGFNVKKLDYQSSGIAAVDASVIEQCSTMLIKNKTTHHIINCVA